MPMSPEEKVKAWLEHRKDRQQYSALEEEKWWMDRERTRYHSEPICDFDYRPEYLRPIPHPVEQLEAMEEGRGGVEEEMKETLMEMHDADGDDAFDKCMKDMVEQRKTDGKAPMPNWMDLPEEEGCAFLKEFCKKKKVLLHNEQKMFLRSNGQDDIWWSDADDDDDDDDDLSCGKDGTVNITKTPEVVKICFS